jgi:hypothetical protein
MLAHRALSHALCGPSASQRLAGCSRSFAIVAAAQSPARAPSLADITPNSAASFNKKQQEFRDELIAVQKQKEQQES